jgi:hypothetical protein
MVTTIPMATPVATLRPLAEVRRVGNRLSPAVLLSGWRDLNSRPLDPQSSAIRTPQSALVRLPWSDAGLYFGERWRQSLNASQLLQSLLQRPQKGDTPKINK